MKNFLTYFKLSLLNFRIKKFISVLIVAISLSTISPVVLAASAIEYGLIAANIALAVSGLSPTAQLLLQGSVYMSDGVNSSSIDSPCTLIGTLLNDPACSFNTATNNPVALRVFAPDGTSVIWTTDALPSNGVLVVDDVDSRLANFTALVAGSYHISALRASTSNPATVTLNAQSAVIANAGLDETVNINSVVSLDGSGSSSSTNTPLTYAWSFDSKPAGSQAAFSDAAVVNPTFTPDKPGQYLIHLTVSTVINNVTYSDSANVMISTNVVPPVADAGAAQTVHPVVSVTLNGSQSYDPNGLSITYSWSLQAPAGSNAVLSDTHAANPSFTADIMGTYTATLVVNDGFLNSDPAIVIINTSNSAPVANAGSSQSTTVGSMVNLNGSSSSDVDNDNLMYQWSFVSKPSGSNAGLSNANSVSASFIPDVAGTYVIGLIVNDGFANSAQSTIQVLAVDSVSSAIQSIHNLQNTISGLSSSNFRNKNMQNTLINKLNAVIADISAGNYSDAISQLQNDILNKTNGCATSGSPSKTDWVTTCSAQGPIYSQIQTIISIIRNLH